MKFGRWIVKFRYLIVIVAIVLLVPAFIGMQKTRINYDMLDYMPENLDTVKGQNILLDEFDKGAFSFIVIEGMDNADVKKLKAKYEQVEHVDSVIWYDTITGDDFPIEMIPDDVYDAFNSGDDTLLAVFFDDTTSANTTTEAIEEIKSLSNKQCFISGMSALVVDLSELAEGEEPIYVVLAVICAGVVMLLLLDGFFIPFVFLISIGIMILFNMGTNVFFGETSYITKALAAVLQLAVTMDYSVFLWHSYVEECEKTNHSDHKEAMARAISDTIVSVSGSSVTTIAGFIALCFMSFTLGLDLGVVMAKGVVLGVLGSVTLLPSLIMMVDKILYKTRHKPLIPNAKKLAERVVKVFPIFVVIFFVSIPVAYYGYSKANDEVYYDLSSSLPDDMDVVIANSKLAEDFDIGSTHMVLVDSDTASSDVRNMMDEIEEVDGVEYALGLESVIGEDFPKSMIPDSVKTILQSDNYELILINSNYYPASDEVNNQVDELSNIIKSYDSKAMLIGEAPLMKDMINVTAHDFKVVNIVSIAAIFVIILLVEKSLMLPVILIAVIELAIFINLGIAHFTGVQLPFIAPICISTIQLGATVDYAILLTTKYKKYTMEGKDKRTSVSEALAGSIPSILVSGVGLFAATFGVSIYSNIDMISSICTLLARGAVVSMICVIFLLPALLLLCDAPVRATTIGLRKFRAKNIREHSDETEVIKI